MQVRTRAALIALLVAVAGAGVLGYWFLKRQPDQRLIVERQEMIAEATSAAPRDNQSSGRKSPFRIDESRMDGRVREIRYYRDDDLFALDVLDDRGRTVRRDLFVGSMVRAQLFYDANGTLVTTKFRDKNGNTRTTMPFLPVGSMRSGY